MTKKPWGHEEILLQTEDLVVKKIYVKPNSSLSLQYHEEKTETMFLVSGEGWLEKRKPCGSAVHLGLRKLVPQYIPATVVHRLYTNDSDCVVVEVSSTELDDVVRLEDLYGRVE